MCFNKEFTLLFSAVSIGFGLYVFLGKGFWKPMDKWRRARVAWCFWYFAVMELIQFVDYLVIDQCSNIMNIIWTQLGYYHICFQPLFSNFAFSALDSKNNNRQREQTWKYIFWYCVVAGTLMSLRMIIPSFSDAKNQFLMPCLDSNEGFCGTTTCSTTGRYHLKWQFKLLRPSYVFPSIALHFFNMFVTPILMGQALGSVVLFMSGPFLALLFEASAGERASIWCFFSIMECFITCVTQYFAVRNSIKKTNKD